MIAAMEPRIAIPVLSQDPERDFANYFAALRYSGAEPVAVVRKYDIEDLDGLLLHGGGDIDPGCYGQARLAECGEPDRALDELQFKVLDAFVRARKPVLGVCRGHQLVNVHFRGTLFQHLGTAGDHTKRDGADNVHTTSVSPDSRLFPIYGANPTVNSAHHQGVDQPGAGLQAVQWAADGVVEALEHESLPILCDQWHAESMRGGAWREGLANGDKLFEAFVNRCRRTAGFQGNS